MKICHIALIGLLGIAACSSQNKPLPTVKSDDPVMQLNPDRWTATVNDLTVPPGDGAPRPLPPSVNTGSDQVPSS
jgi:hypothetical protein